MDTRPLNLRPPDLRLLENESLLQLYASDELSDVDRMEVEAQLRIDPAMRAQLHDIRSLQGEVESMLVKLDRIDPINPPASGNRSLMRAMRQQMVETAARPQVKLPTPSPIPWWGWTGGGIAAAVLLFCFWVLGTESHVRSQPRLNNFAYGPADNSDVAPAVADGSVSESPRSQPMELVSIDQQSQRLDDLERRMHEDLRDDWH